MTTAKDFATLYAAQAETVSKATGIRPVVLLAQWGDETDFGNAINNRNNLGNIRCVDGIPCVDGFSQFPSLDSFCAVAINTWHNGDYPAVLAAAGLGPSAQAIAIGESPWDAGHYVGLPPYNYVGGSIIQALKEIQMGTVADLDQAWLTDASERLAAFLGEPAAITVPVTAAELLAAVKAVQAPAPATVDLQPVLDAIGNVTAQVAALRTEVEAIKTKTDKDLA